MDGAITVEEIKVDPPKASEVRIKMLCASICHTDILCCNGIPIVCPLRNCIHFHKVLNNHAYNNLLLHYYNFSLCFLVFLDMKGLGKL